MLKHNSIVDFYDELGLGAELFTAIDFNEVRIQVYIQWSTLYSRIVWLMHIDIEYVWIITLVKFSVIKSSKIPRSNLSFSWPGI